MLPIYIMTRNDSSYLFKCVKSIISTIRVDYVITIVDNNSDDIEHISILKKLEKHENVNIVYNKSNNWILGLNEVLSKSSKFSNDYFFITDGDIDFTKCTVPLEYDCWMSYLLSIMDGNCSIGKIGLSLDWSFIEKNNMCGILEQEKTLYSEDKKIGNLYVSAVDTTACLFRKNWSVEEKGLLYPDHMRYIKPELYSCRTSRDICVEHLGWFDYKTKSQSKMHINEKVKCFTLVGGTLKDEIVALADFRYRLMYRLLSKPIFKFWVIKRIYYATSYFIKKVTKLYFGHDSKVNL